MQPRGTHDRCQRTQLLFFVWGFPLTFGIPHTHTTSSKISPWFPLPWAAFYPICLHYKTLCFSLDYRLPEGMTGLSYSCLSTQIGSWQITYIYETFLKEWMDGWLLYNMKVTAFRSLSEKNNFSAHTRAVPQLHLDDISELGTKMTRPTCWGEQGKTTKKWKFSFSLRFRAPQSANLFYRKDLKLPFFFFEKIAQTLCQSEYSLCPQKSMSLSQ